MDQGGFWSRDFVLVTLSRVCASAVFSMLTTTLALFSFDVYNASAAIAGVVIGAFIIGALVSRLIAGKFLDIVGRKRMILIGALAYFLTAFLYLIPVPLWLFVSFRFLHGCGFGILSNTQTSVATSYIPRERLGEGLGFFSLGTTLSNALGPFLGLATVQLCGYTALFVASVVVGFMALLLVSPLRIQEVELSDEEKDAVTKSMKVSTFVYIHAIPLTLTIFLVTMAYASVTSFLSPYNQEYGLSESTALFFGVYAAVLLATRPLFGRLMDVKGDNAVVYPSYACLIIGLLFLCFWHATPGIVSCAALLAVGYGCMFSCCQAIVMKSTPERKVGVATSTFFVFVDAGQGVGPAILGSLVPFFGYVGMYLFASALAFIALLMYFALHGRTYRKDARR